MHEKILKLLGGVRLIVCRAGYKKKNILGITEKSLDKRQKKAAREENAAWERGWGLPENGEIFLICKRRAKLEAKQLLISRKPSRYNYYELLISHLHIDSLLFLTAFLGIDLLIGEALYHVHYEASRDIGCIFLFESVCDVSTNMSPLRDHAMWLPFVHFCFFFLCFVFLVVFFCFSMGILGAWH